MTRWCYLLFLVIPLSLPSFLFLPAEGFQNVMLLFSDAEDSPLVVDGKWTYDIEWEQGARSVFSYHSATLFVYSIHDEDYLYVLLELVTDTADSGTAGGAYVCFDTDHDGESPDVNDYCFSADMEVDGRILRGSETGERWIEIDKHEEVEVKGLLSSSPNNSVEHPVYEFKIPFELIGRSDEYGFYALVVDGNAKYAVPNERSHRDLIPDPLWWALLIKDSENVFDVKAQLSNGSITIIDVDHDNNILFIFLTVDRGKEGELTITLPRDLIDSRIKGDDIDFAVVINEDYQVPYEEISTTSTERVLRIDVPEDTFEVEIIGTYTNPEAIIIPEFPMMILAMFALAFLGMIGVTRLKIRLSSSQQ